MVIYYLGLKFQEIWFINNYIVYISEMQKYIKQELNVFVIWLCGCIFDNDFVGWQKRRILYIQMKMKKKKMMVMFMGDIFYEFIGNRVMEGLYDYIIELSSGYYLFYQFI